MVTMEATYDFSETQFGESEECPRRVETALGCDPSECVPRIETGRSIDVESLCSFSEVEKMQKSVVDGLNSNTTEDPTPQTHCKSSEIKIHETIEDSNSRESPAAIQVEVAAIQVEVDPTLRTHLQNLANSKKKTSKKIAASLVKNPSPLKPKGRLQSPSQSKNNKLHSLVKRETSVQNGVATRNLAQENQAIKAKKSKEGRSRQMKSNPTTLTRPKEAVLERAQRVRLFKMKSAAELEEEMMAKMPKFKAIPLNKRILKAPTFPPIPRSAPQVTKFQEFHLETEARANKVAEKHVTKPQETDARIPRPIAVAAGRINKIVMIDKPRRENQLLKNTMPNLFQLHTEERGAAKKRKFVTALIQKKREKKKRRILRANIYPYSTDYPVILPKLEPKSCTKPEPFQLKSLVRHEEEIQKMLEENRKREKKEAGMRIFKAQPVIKEDPFSLPEKVRKPLTRFQPFNLQVDYRAIKREEFD